MHQNIFLPVWLFLFLFVFFNGEIVFMISEKRIIEALEKNGGWITPTAQALGISRQGLDQRIRRSAALKEFHESMKEKYIDLAESKIIKAIKEEKPWAICFYLKCQGKHRGWIETHRQEHSGIDGGPIEKVVEVIPDYSKLSRVELKQLREISAKLNAKT